MASTRGQRFFSEGPEGTYFRLVNQIVSSTATKLWCYSTKRQRMGIAMFQQNYLKKKKKPTDGGWPMGHSLPTVAVNINNYLVLQNKEGLG